MRYLRPCNICKIRKKQQQKHQRLFYYYKTFILFTEQRELCTRNEGIAPKQKKIDKHIGIMLLIYKLRVLDEYDVP